MVRVMISAGEASGDMHGADLVEALRRRVEDIQLFGMGGPLLRDAGVDLLFNPTSMSTVGFVEALRSAQVMRRTLQRFADAMDERRPDAVVCIDFPGFNMKLAELAHRRNIPCLYYLSPSVWAWGRGRAERLKRLGVEICAVFPFEEATFREIGAQVQFVGHPLLDRVRPERSRSEVREQLGVEADAPLIVLMPGSREQELKQLLPPMLDAARLVAGERPESRFVLPVAHTLTARDVEGHVPGGGEPPILIVEGHTYDVLAAADAGVLSMGTATLEAALLGLPHVACYKVSGATYVLARSMVKVKHFALPNIIADRRIVPEFVQSDVTGRNLAEALTPLLDEPGRTAMNEQLSTVRAALGEPGAAGRVADAVLAAARRSGADKG